VPLALDETPIPLLFLIADTGGGHRAAARAVSQALERAYPMRFAPVLHDPLGGPESSRLLRYSTGLYGPLIRFAPWLWGAAYHGTDSRAAMRVLRSTLLARADASVAAAVAEYRPAAIVSFHPFTGQAAVSARRRAAPDIPVVTVITDLSVPHTAWRYPAVDQIVVPTALSRRVCTIDFPDRRCVQIGLPVGPAFHGGPLTPADRAALRRSLGVPEDRFLVVLTGGGEGSGGLAVRATALLRHCPEVQVVTICGRNRPLHRRLSARAEHSDGRLTVLGFVANMADWLRCADLVVGKAGPGTIAEATCCGSPLLLTSRLPGQETGNPELVVRAGAGRYAPGVRDLVRQVEELRHEPASVEAMRIASARISRPAAAAEIATLLAKLASETVHPDQQDGVLA
jgi:1,2-diacylglycerol 3-beta-galactosyltransferase